MTSIALNDNHKRDGVFRLSNADAVLFDIDGTLLNSRDGVHYNSFHAALRQVWGVETKIDGVPLHGNTDIGILRAVMVNAERPREDFERGLPDALAAMCADAERNAAEMRPEVCPSIAELLVRLRAAGKLLGVASGNLERIGWAKLRAAGLREYFAFGSFSDKAERRADIFRNGVEEAKRRLFPEAVVCVVGDTPQDVEAAQEIGIPVIATATGHYDQATLTKCGPTLCVPCCTDLLEGLR